MAGIFLLGQAPATPTGQKGQINFNGLAGEYDFPFINQASLFTVFVAADSPSQDVYSLFNSDNYPTALATGSSRWHAFGPIYYPGGYATFTGSVSGSILTVSSAVTGDPLADGRTIRSIGSGAITDQSRITSQIDATHWNLSQSSSSTGSITISAFIPIILDWTGNVGISLGFGTLVTLVDAITVGNRKEYYLSPVPGAVFTGSINANILTISSFSSGSAVIDGQAISGKGMPPFSKIGGSGGTGIYTFGNTVSYTTTNEVYTTAATTLGTHLPNCELQISSITTTPGAIRIFRQDQEALLNGGQLCAPHFISYYSQYGRARFLNWLQTNGNMMAQWLQRPTTTQFSWPQNNVVPALYGGTATKSSKNDYIAPNTISYTDSSGVTQSNPSSWTDGMMMQTQITALPTFKAVTGMVWTGSATKITAVGHGFTTGDVVCFPAGEISGGNWEGNLNFGIANGLLAKCYYTITFVDVDNFTLDGINSSTWGTYSSGGHVGWQMRFKSGLLPYKQITSPDILQTPPLATFNALIQQTNQSIVDLVYSADLDVLLMRQANAGSRGIPIETACQICNELGIDGWMSVPMYATDRFVTQMATLIKATLNHAAGRKWLFELSNEVWNTGVGFSQSVYAEYKPYAQFPGVFSNSSTAMYEWYGLRFYQMSTLINAVYSGADHAKCVRIFGFKTDDSVTAATFNTSRAESPSCGLPAFPISLADELCCATYLGNGDVNNGGSGDFANQSLAAQAIGTYQQGVLTSNSSMITTALGMCDTAFNSYLAFIGPRWSGYQTLAAHYNVRMSAYEGGFTTVPDIWFGGGSKPCSPMSYLGIPFNSLDALMMWTAYQLSSQFGASYTGAIAQWTSYSGTYFSQYQSTGLGPAPLSMWAMRYPSIFGATNPGEIAFNAYNAS